MQTLWPPSDPRSSPEPWRSARWFGRHLDSMVSAPHGGFALFEALESLGRFLRGLCGYSKYDLGAVDLRILERMELERMLKTDEAQS